MDADYRHLTRPLDNSPNTPLFVAADLDEIAGSARRLSDFLAKYQPFVIQCSERAKTSDISNAAMKTIQLSGQTSESPVSPVEREIAKYIDRNRQDVIATEQSESTDEHRIPFRVYYQLQADLSDILNLLKPKSTADGSMESKDDIVKRFSPAALSAVNSRYADIVKLITHANAARWDGFSMDAMDSLRLPESALNQMLEQCKQIHEGQAPKINKSD